MKAIYYVFSEATAEEDAFFDENDQLLARWNGNDAAWRPHYMEPLLDKLGIKVVHATGEHKERLLEILRKLFIEEQGYDPYGAEEG